MALLGGVGSDVRSAVCGKEEVFGPADVDGRGDTTAEAEECRWLDKIISSLLFEFRNTGWSVTRRWDLVRVPFGAVVVYTTCHVRQRPVITCLAQLAHLTFREQTRATVRHVPPQEPAVAEVIVALDQLNSVPLGQTQLIGASSDEVVNHEEDGTGMRLILDAVSRGHGDNAVALQLELTCARRCDALLRFTRRVPPIAAFYARGPSQRGGGEGTGRECLMSPVWCGLHVMKRGTRPDGYPSDVLATDWVEMFGLQAKADGIAGCGA